MESKDNKKDSFLDRNIGILFILLIVIVFGGYILLSWYSPSPMSDCDYTNNGCQGNNRWGQ